MKQREQQMATRQARQTAAGNKRKLEDDEEKIEIKTDHSQMEAEEDEGFLLDMADTESQSSLEATTSSNDVMVATTGDPSSMKIIRVVREKGCQPSAKLITAKGVSLDPNSEEAEACTRQGYENLLRDLLTCLAKKYRIEEPCGSSQVKKEIWRQLTNEYLQLTGGLVNVSQKEVMRKWTNMKFTSKSKRLPHPLLRAETLDIHEVERKLKLCQRFVIGDEAIKRVETTKRLEAIKEQVKAKNLEEQAEKESRPPLKRLERQILTETLRYEQEKLTLLRETSRMEREKLSKDVELAEISIEKARYELELLKRRQI